MSETGAQEVHHHPPCLAADDPLWLAASAQAQRTLSPRGLDSFLAGAGALCQLGRGVEPVRAWLRAMPEVARELGEDVLPAVSEAAMKLASHTSGSVITLLLDKLPLAASRLGDAELLRGFLALLHRMSGSAPRALRPLLENLDELLSALTLGGLRRWVNWGAEAHRRDLDGQLAYFSLRSESARAVLQKERRGTLFIDNQRKLNFYLRSLWARAFLMRPTAGDYESREGLKPWIEDFQIHLPDAFDAVGEADGLSIYRAAVAHCAAHMVYTTAPLSGEALSPVQRRCVELFEDARIEQLAHSEFPGLRTLWLGFFEHALDKPAPGRHPALELMLRTARALLDPAYRDPAPWLHSAVERFREQLAIDPGDNHSSLIAGLQFHQQLASHAAIPGEQVLSNWPVPYRDDNRYCWAFDENPFEREGHGYLPDTRGQVRKYVSSIEMANEVDCELAGDDAQEVWVNADELYPYEDQGVSFNDMWGKEPISAPVLYPEWDYQVQLSRPGWTTLTERRQGLGDPALMDDILDKYKPVASRIKYLIDALQPQGVVRQRGHEEGEELDLNAAVRAMIDIRRGVMPDPRINIRVTRHVRDLAIVLLLDLSESTNDRIGPLREGEDGYQAQPRVLDLTREAAGLLSWAIDAIGDRFAVHGFASDGRHDVQYYRFKDFDQRYEAAKPRLAGMRGGLSTRMGAALRHAGEQLAAQPAQRRLVLLLTDGAPADIDERDPQYLRHDAKRAVEELAARGIHTHCLSLDPEADRYVARIFGDNHYAVVDRVEKLPERLPGVFAALTG